MEKFSTAGQATDVSMRIACWIPKATDTHSKFVILIAIPAQQRFRERVLMLCLYVHCLSC